VSNSSNNRSGRGGRGSGDFCIVILAGHDLTGWIDRPSNQNLLTSSTRAQLTIGNTVTGEIESVRELYDTINKCLRRDEDWKRYHAATLAELVTPTEPAETQLKFAAAERKTFDLLRRNMFDEAIQKINKHIERERDALDIQVRGWLRQLAARIALYWQREELARELQQSAYIDNDNLHRPLTEQRYVQIQPPGEQSQSIVAGIKNFRSKRGFLADFEATIALLAPTATSNQFEQSLAKLGTILGFSTERPDHKYGVGPDVLWLLDNNTALVIEVKSQKQINNPLTKREHGQLLSAAEWFKSEYPGYGFMRVSMHPNKKTGDAAVTNDTKVLTFEKLSELVGETRKLIIELDKSSVSKEGLQTKCEEILKNLNLTPDKLPEQFLELFENDK